MARTHLPHPISRDSAIGGMEIDRSLRVDQGTSNVSDGSFYYRTFADGNKKTFTISVWFKKCYTVGNIGDYSYTIISCGGGGSGSYAGRFGFDSYQADQLKFVINNPAPTNHARAQSNRRFRDNAWYHAVLAYDSTQSTESDRMKMYINGELETLHSDSVYPSQNYEGYFNNNVVHRVGATSSWSTGADLGQFNGYLAEFHFVDGTAYDASYFGFTEQQTGVWRPKRVTGLTYGTNGFYLDFKDNTSTTTIGYDKSGKANHFTPHDVQVSDSVPDSPTNDFCMMSGLNKNSGLSHGNLQFYKWDDSSAALVTCQATMDIPNTGKWVWEHRWTGYQHTRYWAMTRRMRAQGAYLDSSAYVYYDMYDGKTVSGLNGSVVTTLTGGQASYGDNVTRFWMMACDMDDMKARFYYNNTLISTIAIPELPDDGKGNYVWTWTSTNGGSGSTYDDRFNFGQDSTYFGAASLQNKTDASGLGQFYTTVPDGHKCLCTKNLPPRTDVLVEPQKHFDTILYTPVSGKTVDGLEFTPDLIWVKSRTQAYSHYWFDVVRGTGQKGLKSDVNEQEGSDSTSITSFNRGGFTIPGTSGINDTGSGTDGVVAWCWKAGGSSNTFNVNGTGYATASAAGITDGNVAITGASVNTKNGFSIVTYTGSTASGALTVGHGLGKKPAMVIIKRRDSTGEWIVGHQGLATNAFANNKFLKLDSSSSVFTNSLVWGVEPTTTVTQIVTNGAGGASNLTSSGTYVMYSWAEIPGYSKFGSYVGNGDSDGTFVNVGFKPAWVVVKKTNTANNFVMFDNKRSTTNVMDDYLAADDNAAESSTSSVNVDFLSNGFKFRSAYDIVNSGDYIYMAFADQTSLNQYNLAVNGR